MASALPGLEVPGGTASVPRVERTIAVAKMLERLTAYFASEA
jgi:hypothetical protein